MPTHRLFDMVSILSKLGQLHKTVRFDSHTRRSVGTESWNDKYIWVVTLGLNDKEHNIQLNVVGEGNEFAHALEEAWIKLTRVTHKGMGVSALMPPVEQRALANGQTEATDN